MEIGATKAVQDRLKTTTIEESKGASLVFCWDTNLTKIKGRNVLFIVNASNRYTIAMTDIESRNWNYYAMYISRVIHGVMQEMGSRVHGKRIRLRPYKRIAALFISLL